MTLRRVGFACKLSKLDNKLGVVSIPEYNTKTTTAAWMNRQSTAVAEQRLADIISHNITSCKKLVQYIGELTENLRMVRLSSDILPLYTHRDWRHFYKSYDVRQQLEREFSAVGTIARESNVRLSFHPGQFCVLASSNDGIVNNSIEEFEYHADMARWMGYGKKFQDFKINVHIAGQRGPQGIKAVLPRLSTEARNSITIENDEISWGIDASLELADDLALVLDIHHHHIHSGEYIESSDPRIERIIESWRGVRPVIHYSSSREDLLVGHDKLVRPDLKLLLESGYKKAKLRAHSDMMWNTALNDWAYTHWQWADVMVESKAKNIASFALYEYWSKKYEY